MGWFLTAAYWAWWPIQDIRFRYVLPKIFCISLGLLICSWRAEKVMVPRRVLYALGLAFVTVFFSPWPGLSLEGAQGEWSHGFWALCVYAMLTGLPGRRRWAPWALTGLAVHAAFQQLGLDPFWRQLPGGQRSVAWIASPIDLGGILAALSVVLWPFAPIAWLGIVAAKSRGALAAAALAFVRIPRSWRFAGLAVLLGASLLSTKPTDVGRREVWKVAGQMFLEHPVTGVGLDFFGPVFLKRRSPEFNKAMGRNNATQAHAHSIVLEAAATGGIFGLAALALLLPFALQAQVFALFAVLMFNPMSFEVLATGALLCARFPCRRVDVRPWAIGLGALSAFWAWRLMLIKQGWVAVG